MSADHEGRWTLPRVVEDAIFYLKESESSLQVEGIFRRSPNAGVLRGVAEAYDRGEQTSRSTAVLF